MLTLDAKVPTGNFTVRCPRCQNLIRVQPGAKGKGSSTVQQLEANAPAPAVKAPAAADTHAPATDALKSEGAAA